MATAPSFVIGMAVAGAGDATAMHPWGCYKWPNSNVTYTNIAQGNYYNFYEQETVTDSNSWHNYTVMNFSSGNGISMQSGFYGNNGWLGLTSITTNGCTITSSTTKLNRTYLDGSNYTDDNRKTVACHEVGHSTGLAHNTQNTSCLKSGLPAPSNPNAHDQQQLQTIYGGGTQTPVPTNTPIPTWTASSTPVPTMTPSATNPPGGFETPTNTPQPSATQPASATPSATSVASATPSATSASSATPTSQPSSTPTLSGGRGGPSSTPMPSSTSAPSSTPSPTGAPK
jgi:hypothetical protein